MIVSNTETNPKKRDLQLKRNQVVSYMQSKYLEMMYSLAMQARKQNKLFDEFPGTIALTLQCEKELGYAH
jgi:hypothetical protein